MGNTGCRVWNADASVGTGAAGLRDVLRVSGRRLLVWMRVSVQVCLVDRVSWLTDWCAGWDLTGGGVETGLDQVLSFWLSDEWLKFCGCKSVDETGFGDDQ